jgi:D-alanyl-D-alanine carboxypeptidase
MDRWLREALNYLPEWLAYQMRAMDRVGCAIAVSHNGRVVFEQAFGYADLGEKIKLTPRHRFRVASHSKCFTAAGIMTLREQGKLRLDDPVGEFVDDLHPDVADLTLNQLLTHSSGIIRDGLDAGQWSDRRPFASRDELRAALREAPVIDGSERFKYSNHGYGLLGLVIEAVTGENYVGWIERVIVGRAGLKETNADWRDGLPLNKLARGHTDKIPLGKRAVIPCENDTSGLASATGFVATAADIAKFFGSIDPAAKKSILTSASRREMVRAQWSDSDMSTPEGYGLGLSSGMIEDWRWFGHGGGFQGCLSQTAVLRDHGVAISIITNSADGLAASWLDGAVRILRAFQLRGASSAKTRPWQGRWWSTWGANDLVPFADHVVVADPGLLDPFTGDIEVAVTGRDTGVIRKAAGYRNYGEGAKLLRQKNGTLKEVQLAGYKLVSESRIKSEFKKRYKVADE